MRFGSFVHHTRWPLTTRMLPTRLLFWSALRLQHGQQSSGTDADKLRQACRHAQTDMHRQTDRQTDRRAGGQAGRQAGRQADIFMCFIICRDLTTASCSTHQHLLVAAQVSHPHVYTDVNPDLHCNEHAITPNMLTDMHWNISLRCNCLVSCQPQTFDVNKVSRAAMSLVAA